MEINRQHVIELIEMWREKADIYDKFGERFRAVFYRDCANDLEMILNGDLSPIEKTAK